MTRIFSQNLFRLNLDASRVPEALVNSFRLLTQLRTRLNPPEPQTQISNLGAQLRLQELSLSLKTRDNSCRCTDSPAVRGFPAVRGLRPPAVRGLQPRAVRGLLLIFQKSSGLNPPLGNRGR